MEMQPWRRERPARAGGYHNPRKGGRLARNSEQSSARPLTRSNSQDIVRIPLKGLASQVLAAKKQDWRTQ